jgi:hypothetical protein
MKNEILTKYTIWSMIHEIFLYLVLSVQQYADNEVQSCI